MNSILNRNNSIITVIVLITIGIANHAFSQISFPIPNSPNPSDYKANTWEEKLWIEKNIPNESPAQVLKIPGSPNLRAYKSTSLTPVEIEEIDFPVLSITLPDSANESETFQGIIRIDQPLFIGSFFQLMVNPTNVVIEPEFIFMPAGLTETTCDLAIHGVDITQTISITPTEGFWTSYSDTIEIIPVMFPESERQALIDLYNSTDGSNWNRSDNWLGERGTECSWSGVICDDYNLHVTIIFMRNNNLNGDIPDAISHLQNLSELDLSENHLKSLPETIGNLQHLSELNIGNNQLVRLPESFSNLHNLSNLFLSFNQLRSLPENFGNLHNLIDILLAI